MQKWWATAVALVSACAAAVAAESGAPGSLGLTAKLSTLGYGGDLTLGLGPHLSLRAGYTTLSYEDDFDLDTATVNGELDWETIPVLLDLHPFGGGFRLSAGYVQNNNEVLLSVDPGEIVEFQGLPFKLQDLQGAVEFDQDSYYVGFGYGNAAGTDQRWHFSCDFGAMYHGEPTVQATATASNPSVQRALDAALKAEVAEYQDDIKEFTLYPVVAFGISYRF